MKKFKLIRKDNGKFIIKKKGFLFGWETLQGTGEFNTAQDCVNYIYSKYNEKICDVQYHANW